MTIDERIEAPVMTAELLTRDVGTLRATREPDRKFIRTLAGRVKESRQAGRPVPLKPQAVDALWDRPPGLSFTSPEDFFCGLTSATREHDNELIRGLLEATQKTGENIRALARIAEIREPRPTALKGEGEA